MAYQTLTPTVLPKNFTATNLDTAPATTVTSGAGNGVTFANDNQSFLIIQVGATATTLTVKVGATVAGIAVTSQSVVLTTSATNLVGPFDSVLNQAGGNNVQIDFSNSTAVTVGLFKHATAG